MNKRILLFILVLILVIGVVAAASISYVSNSIDATVNVDSQCSDGIDNDSANGADFPGDTSCSSECDPTEGIVDGNWTCL